MLASTVAGGFRFGELDYGGLLDFSDRTWVIRRCLRIGTASGGRHSWPATKEYLDSNKSFLAVTPA